MAYYGHYRLRRVIVSATIIESEGDDPDEVKRDLNETLIEMGQIGPDRFVKDEPMGISGNKKS